MWFCRLPSLCRSAYCRPGSAESLRARWQRYLATIVCNLDVPASDPGDLVDVPPEHTVEIVAADCIGCTKCISACPVDAIIGSHGVMHSVIESECTGCNLCIQPCPVDCIMRLNQAHSYPCQSKKSALTCAI